MSELYKAIAGSPITYLAGDISAAQTTIAVADDTTLPDAPNICTIGYGENIETIRYGAKSNGVLQNVTRGIEGTPRAWPAGTEVARFFTAYDHNAIINTLVAHQTDLNNIENGIYDISDYSYHKFSIGGIPKFEIKDTDIEVYGDISLKGGGSKIISLSSSQIRDTGSNALILGMNSGGTIHLRPRTNNTDTGGVTISDGLVSVSGGIQATANSTFMGNATINGEVISDRFKGQTSTHLLHVGGGNCRIDTNGGIMRLYVSAIGTADNGIFIATNGALGVKCNNVLKHQFRDDGTKTGGTIEIEGTTYGMSPIDSPQVLIEDVLFDVKVNGRTKIQLDNIFAKSISQYAVFSSCGQVQIVEKGVDYFIVDGYTGTVDFRIVGKRVNEEHRYFEIMGGFEHGVAEEVNI